MSTPSWLRPVGGVVAVAALVVAAAVLVALAADVLRWDRQVRDGDAAYTARAAASWEPDTLLPRGVSASLLGVEDDVAFRRAVDQFWRSEPREPHPRVRGRDPPERGRAQPRADGRPRPEPRAPARLTTLRAALLFEEARNSPTQRQVFVRRAIEQLQRAVTLDPTDETAIYDLELALKLLRAVGLGGRRERRHALTAAEPRRRRGDVGRRFLTHVRQLPVPARRARRGARRCSRCGRFSRRGAAPQRRRRRSVSPAAGRRTTIVDLALSALVAGLVALAAAQPVVARSEDDLRTRGDGGARRDGRHAIDARSSRAERAEPPRPGTRHRKARAERASRHARRGRLAHRPGAAAPVPDARVELVRRGGRPGDRDRAPAARSPGQARDRLLGARRSRPRRVLPARHAETDRGRPERRRDGLDGPRGATRPACERTCVDGLRPDLAR